MEQIQSIFQDLRKEVITIEQAEKQVLDLFAVRWRIEQLPHHPECELIHSTDWNGKCFICGKQVFVR